VLLPLLLLILLLLLVLLLLVSLLLVLLVLLRLLLLLVIVVSFRVVLVAGQVHMRRQHRGRSVVLRERHGSQRPHSSRAPETLRAGGGGLGGTWVPGDARLTGPADVQDGRRCKMAGRTRARGALRRGRRCDAGERRRMRYGRAYWTGAATIGGEGGVRSRVWKRREAARADAMQDMRL